MNKDDVDIIIYSQRNGNPWCNAIENKLFNEVTIPLAWISSVFNSLIVEFVSEDFGNLSNNSCTCCFTCTMIDESKLDIKFERIVEVVSDNRPLKSWREVSYEGKRANFANS